MIIRDKNGTERIAMTYDFQDVTITFTPSEWKELVYIFTLHKKNIRPDVFSNNTLQILEKLEANQPALKEGYEKVQDATIKFTPSEWQELVNNLRSLRSNVFAKINHRILEKLEDNQPALKEGYEKVQDGWSSISNEEESE